MPRAVWATVRPVAPVPHLTASPPHLGAVWATLGGVTPQTHGSKGGAQLHRGPLAGCLSSTLSSRAAAGRQPPVPRPCCAKRCGRRSTLQAAHTGSAHQSRAAHRGPSAGGALSPAAAPWGQLRPAAASGWAPCKHFHITGLDCRTRSVLNSKPSTVACARSSCCLCSITGPRQPHCCCGTGSLRAVQGCPLGP